MAPRSPGRIDGAAMVVGPFLRLEIGGGHTADLFLLRYGTDGGLLSPQTEELLKRSLVGKTDIFVFSHGWNNAFDAAASYRTFIQGYLAQGARPGAKPVLVGVIWPSISYLLPWEDGPQIAADPQIGTFHDEEMRRFVAESLDPAAQARLSELLDGSAGLAPEDARRAAEIVRDALWPETDPDDGSKPPRSDELPAAWALLDGGAKARPGSGPVGFARATAAPAEASGPGEAARPDELGRSGGRLRRAAPR